MILVFANNIFANENHPYRYEIISQNEEGYYFIANQSANQTSNLLENLKSYLIKADFANNSTQFYYWNQIKRNNPKGIFLNAKEVIFVNPEIKEDNKIAFHCFSQNLNNLEYFLLNENGEVLNQVILDQFQDVQSEIKFKFIAKYQKTYSNKRIKNQNDFSEYYYMINSKLIKIDLNSNSTNYEILNDNVSSACLINDNYNGIKLAYIKKYVNNSVIYLIDTLNYAYQVSRLNSVESKNIVYNSKDNKLILNNSENISKKIEEFSLNNFTIKTMKLSNTYDNFKSFYIEDNLFFVCLNKQNNNFSLDFYQYHNSELEFLKSIDLAEQFIELNTLKIVVNEKSQSLFCIFRNGFIEFELKNIKNLGKELSSEYCDLSLYANVNFDLTSTNKFLVFSSINHSTLFEKKSNNFWLFNKTINTNGKYIIPFFSLLIVLLFYKLYKNQKRMLKAVLELPSAGFVFLSDRSGKLIKSNEEGKKLLQIYDFVSMGKYFEYYCISDHTQAILALFEKALNVKENFNQKITFVLDNKVYEYYCSAVMLYNLTGSFRGIVLSGVDITQELENQRLSNWAQLAHDMQTNLSTIKLNAEQFVFEDGSINNDRKRKIIQQVNLLINRVRDIVTVGRKENISKTPIQVSEIIDQVINEFDQSLYNNIIFETEYKNFNFYCDKAKIIRALRNTMENAIKAMRNNGGILKLRAYSESNFAYFTVKDSGIGMDEETKNKMMTPFFTGSNENGTGIGTMIIQNVLEQHGGSIIVHTEKGKGTEVIFKFPNYTK